MKRELGSGGTEAPESAARPAAAPSWAARDRRAAESAARKAERGAKLKSTRSGSALGGGGGVGGVGGCFFPS